jgi:3'-phosphoadenosine 5'-phosphosulfate sulfotransferase (PAPS reductase)/FAD synthetase
MKMIHDKQRLKELQALPLERKILITQTRIIEWYNHYKGQVYVSFSGGKDSTVLLDIARKCFPDIEAVFVNTGLEFPEIQSFVRKFDNVTILRPKMRFDEVIKKYGYPLISKEVGETVSQAKKSLETNSKKYTYRLKKLNGELLNKEGQPSQFNMTKYKPLLYADFNTSNKCCDIMKKQPAKKFEKETDKKPITAQMAEESMLRQSMWLRRGCNAFDGKRPISNPMSFWTEQDVLWYIKKYNLPIATVYGDIVEDGNKLKTTGCSRTGCIFCGFGCHLEKHPSRFELLKETHPKQYDYCLNGGEYVCGVWKPNKQGLGMKHVFDELNKIYGDGFIKY